jgi:hypothetical protein
MIKYFNILLITLIFTSCVSSTTIVDTDDLYFRKHIHDTTAQIRRHRSFYYIPSPGLVTTYGWGYSYGYPYHYHRPQTIIVVPKQDNTNYGKRPTREGTHQTVPQRGRRNN